MIFLDGTISSALNLKQTEKKNYFIDFQHYFECIENSLFLALKIERSIHFNTSIKKMVKKNAQINTTSMTNRINIQLIFVIENNNL